MEHETQATTYNQARLLDALLKHFQLRRDSELARRLDIPRSFICKARKGQRPIGPVIMLRMHEESGISIKKLRAIMGDRRKWFRGAYSLHGPGDRSNNHHARLGVR